MATPTYIPLATITLASAAPSVTFASIPSGYRDLVFSIVAPRSTATNGDFYVNFNDDFGAYYSRVYMMGNGSSTASGSSTNNSLIIGYNNNTQAYQSLFIFDYAQTNKHKSTLSRSNASNLEVHAMAGRWASTAAITSIEFTYTVNIAAGSTFSLYGIAG